ncbi:MAG: DNA primase [Clostridiales bacterium]|nr:DNA primase [Clostridiales bacterium]
MTSATNAQMNISVAEQIKEKVDIVDAVGRVVALKKQGRASSGLCPFHNESGPSFYVYEDSQSYYCFGCRAYGDVIRFYEQYYHLDFRDACERLGAEYGITLDWGRGRFAAADRRRDALYEVNAEAANHYYRAIRKEGNPGLVYLLGRGVGAETIKSFGIGYADESGRSFAGALAGDAEKTAAAQEVGLIDMYGGEYRDRYRGRVMFPIVNTRGKVIGFGGRDITGAPKTAKYINSKDSRAFSKGSNLFALNRAQNSIREHGCAILVEGYMDAIALHVQGVTHAVAQLGTALTAQQARLLSRYTKNIILSLDNDEAGQKAAEENARILREADLKVRVLTLNDAKDPDEYIRKFGRAAFDAAAKSAAPVTAFRLERLRSRFGTGDPESLSDFLKEAAKMLAALEPVEAELYAKKLAQDTGISEGAILSQIRQNRQKAEEAPRAVRRQSVPKRQNGGTYDALLAEMLAYPLKSARHTPRVEACRQFFAESVYAPIFAAITDAEQTASGEIDTERLRELPADEDTALLDTVLRCAEHPGAWSEQALEELIRKTEVEMLRRKEADLRDVLEQEEPDAEILLELDGLLKRIKTLEDENRRATDSIPA